MTERCGYELRQSNGTYRRVSPRTKKRRSKISSDEQQAIFDAVNVETYNDSPQHMYGLDKIENDIAESVHRRPSITSDKNAMKMHTRCDGNKFQVRWHALTLYFVLLLILLEGANRIFFTSVQNHDIVTDGNHLHDTIERLIDQINMQKNYIEEFRSTIKVLQSKQGDQAKEGNNSVQQKNCSCVEQIQLLRNEDKAQKLFVESMQQQILTTVDVVKSLNDHMTNLERTVKHHEEENKRRENGLCQGEDCQFPADSSILASIETALENYHADILGLADFALESAGASIHGAHHSETCNVGAPIIKVFGLPLWQDPRSPRTVIRPDNAAGNCWPFKGSSGYITIKLATEVRVTMFSLEHLDKRLDQYSTDMYQSAPKQFEVFAWLDKGGKEKVKLGTYVYERNNKSAIQIFKTRSDLSKPVNYVELRVLSNYGNKDCTCLYRFRVHGISKYWEDLEK